jgi:hypothetical protein
MKTSNKLLIALVLIAIVYSIANAFALKAEYLKGDFKSRFFGMNKVSLNGFDVVDNNVANALDVTVEYGKEYAVWIDKKAVDDVTISKKGSVLNIDFKRDDVPAYRNRVVIICPRLSSLKSGYKSLMGKDGGAITTIRGFTQDSLLVRVNNATQLNLDSNNLKKLDAQINAGELTLTKTNKITMGSFEVKSDAYNHLTIEDAEIEKVKYNFVGDAKVSLTGKALKLLTAQ